MHSKYCSLILQIDKVDFRWFWVISSVEQLQQVQKCTNKSGNLYASALAYCLGASKFSEDLIKIPRIASRCIALRQSLTSAIPPQCNSLWSMESCSNPLQIWEHLEGMLGQVHTKFHIYSCTSALAVAVRHWKSLKTAKNLFCQFVKLDYNACATPKSHWHEFKFLISCWSVKYWVSNSSWKFSSFYAVYLWLCQVTCNVLCLTH